LLAAFEAWKGALHPSPILIQKASLAVGVLTDRIISDFIRDPIRKIMKIIRSVSISEIHLRMRIR
jgi:hypothetical protein